MKGFAFLLPALLLLGCKPQQPESKWIPIFNGKDLTGWDIKITGFPLNENYGNIFRVENGVIKVSYDQLDSFRGHFGHIYYKQKFSKYKLRLEYRFTGGQCPGAPEWALRNSGAMLHSQSAASMELGQDFPVSIEAQFLGGLGQGERTTLNVCTPGTDIDINGMPVEGHCTASASKTYDGDQWVAVEMIVLADSIVHHVIGTDTVLTYSKPRNGPDLRPAGYPVPDGTPLKEGYIALQAEGHPVEFRKVEVMDLSGK